MPTARQIILSGSFCNLRNRKGAAFLDLLFQNFCNYARLGYFSYSATKQRGSGGGALLSDPRGTLRSVDCASLAEALAIMASEDLCLGTTCQAVMVGGAVMKWATKGGSVCFDANIVGNIRPMSAGFDSVRRCVFAEHWIVQTPNLVYDPCMRAIYGTKEDAQAWHLDNPSGPKRSDYYNRVFEIREDPSKFLIRIPEGNAMPPGFKSAFLLAEVHDLDRAVYKDAFGKDKPSWQMRTKSVNQFIKAAGLRGQWDGIK